MVVKTVLILANSVRHLPNACVAGREVMEQAGQRSFGAWIRPVSAHGDGEVSLQERMTSLGREVRVLDIVRMSLGNPVADRLQPENWQHGGAPQWEIVSNGTLADLDRATESPPSIWDEQGDRTDRIGEERARQTPPAQSLLLLALDDLVIRLYSDHYQGQLRKHRRALFSYGNRDYNLSVTDATIETHYRLKVPKPSEEARVHHLGHRRFVCLSLAHNAVGGHHYKLVAAIIDPEHI